MCKGVVLIQTILFQAWARKQAHLLRLKGAAARFTFTVTRMVGSKHFWRTSLLGPMPITNPNLHTRKPASCFGKHFWRTRLPGPMPITNPDFHARTPATCFGPYLNNNFVQLFFEVPALRMNKLSYPLFRVSVTDVIKANTKRAAGAGRPRKLSADQCTWCQGVIGQTDMPVKRGAFSKHKTLTRSKQTGPCNLCRSQQRKTRPDTKDST